VPLNNEGEYNPGREDSGGLFVFLFGLKMALFFRNQFFAQIKMDYKKINK